MSVSIVPWAVRLWGDCRASARIVSVFFAPSPANLSASSFPLTLLCPLVHLRVVVPFLDLTQAVMHLNRLPFWFPSQLWASHSSVYFMRLSIAYLESLMILRLVSGGLSFIAMRIAISLPVWLDWFSSATLVLELRGSLSPYQTPLPVAEFSRPLFTQAPSVYTVTVFWACVSPFVLVRCSGVVGGFGFILLNIVMASLRVVVRVGLLTIISPSSSSKLGACWVASVILLSLWGSHLGRILSISIAIVFMQSCGWVHLRSLLMAAHIVHVQLFLVSCVSFMLPRRCRASQTSFTLTRFLPPSDYTLVCSEGEEIRLVGFPTFPAEACEFFPFSLVSEGLVLFNSLSGDVCG